MMIVMIIMFLMMLSCVIFVVMFVFMKEQFNRVSWLNNSISPTIADVERCFQLSKWINISIASIRDVVWTPYLVMKLSVGTYFIAIIICI